MIIWHFYMSIRYRMLALDFNSSFIPQYRTWVVDNSPDFIASEYSGSKSGTNDFLYPTAYLINDDTIHADILYPLPTHWTPNASSGLTSIPIQTTLPEAVEDAQLAIIDGYAYLFGNRNSPNILKADINNPAIWNDTGKTLPTTLYGSQLAVIGTHIYLFGGRVNDTPSNVIYSASISDPLTWTNTGSTLPAALSYSALLIAGGNIYLFGGKNSQGATTSIYTATVAAPTVWTDTGANLPVALYGSLAAQNGTEILLYGGMTNRDQPSNTILTSTTATPTTWALSLFPLPRQIAFGQYFTMGNDGYIISAGTGPTASNGYTSILQCHLDTPVTWVDVAKIVPGVISHAQLGVIYDRFWIFGGSGSSVMFACNQNNKPNFSHPNVLAYGNITRSILQATDNLNNPFQALGFAWWRTDYLS